MGYVVNEVGGQRVRDYLNSAQRALDEAERVANEATQKRAENQRAALVTGTRQQEIIHFQQELMRDLWATPHNKWNDHQQTLYAAIEMAYAQFRGAKDE